MARDGPLRAGRHPLRATCHRSRRPFRTRPAFPKASTKARESPDHERGSERRPRLADLPTRAGRRSDHRRGRRRRSLAANRARSPAPRRRLSQRLVPPRRTFGAGARLAGSMMGAVIGAMPRTITRPCPNGLALFVWSQRLDRELRQASVDCGPGRLTEVALQESTQPGSAEKNTSSPPVSNAVIAFA